MIRPRWRKIWRDMWRNKRRTVLVILSIAVGVFAVGMIVSTQIILSEDMALRYNATNPASPWVGNVWSFTTADFLVIDAPPMIELQGGYQVAVVGADNRVHLTPVQAGPTMGKLWVVTSGLTPGARVISEGTQSVRDGELVYPKAAAAPAGDR